MSPVHVAPGFQEGMTDTRFCTGIYDERRYTATGAAVSPGKAASAPVPTRARSREKASRKMDSGMVDCPCGVTVDDGEAMIECERCKVRKLQHRRFWASARVAVTVWCGVLTHTLCGTGVGAPVLPAGADVPAPAPLPLQVRALHVRLVPARAPAAGSAGRRTSQPCTGGLPAKRGACLCAEHRGQQPPLLPRVTLP